jgi:predicted site-specific integrase-resolvase
MSRTLLTVDQVVDGLQISRSTWDKWRAKGVAPAVIALPNGQLRVDDVDLNLWLDSFTEVAS